MRFLKNFSWLTISEGVRYSVAVFISILVARYLGPHDYGILSYANALVQIVLPLAYLSFDSIVMRDISQGKPPNYYIGTPFSIRLFSGFVIFVSLFIYTLFFEGEPGKSVIIISSFILIFQPFYVIDFYYKGKQLSEFSALALISGTLLSAVLKIIFILTKKTVVFFALANVSEYIISSFVFSLIYFIKDRLRFSFSFDVLKALMKQASPMILGGLALSVQSRIEQVFIKEFISFEKLGYYIAALRIIELLGIFGTVLHISALPPIAEAKKEDKNLYITRLKKVYRAVFVGFIFFSLIVGFLSDKIVLLVFGEKYAKTGEILLFLLPRLFLSYVGVIRSIYIITENLFVFYLISSLAGALSNIVMGLIFIPRFEVYGAIISSTSSFFVSTIFIDLFSEKMRKNLKIIVESVLRWK